MMTNADSYEGGEPASPSPDPRELLRRTRVEVHHATFALVGVNTDDWARLLAQPDLGPRASAVFMLMRDEHEATMLLDEDDLRVIRPAVIVAKVETGFRLVTLDITLGWDTVGYLALVASVLADARVPVGVISAYSRDHLLIKQEDLPRALLALGPHVAELC